MRISELIGKNYNGFWNFKGRYRVVKGGRGSKKSTTTALWYIYHILKYKKANLMCVRRYYTTLRDSCYAELKKAAIRMGVEDKFIFNISPLEIIVKETGQRILFRGFDNPDSLTSITVPVGFLCWVWVEEAYQIEKKEAFDKLDFSIRGIIDDELFPQFTITLNPWSEMWIKDKFFDVEDNDIMALTRNYYHNEFLSDEDYQLFQKMKAEDPEGYKVAGLGQWGVPGGRYFNEFSSITHVVEPFEIDDTYRRYVAFDYGLDMFSCYFIAVNKFECVVYKEIHQKDLVVSDAVNLLKEYTDKDENIYQYYAPPDMWNRQRESGMSIADVFLDNGIVLTKASNDRIQGWLMVKEYLKLRENEFGIKVPKLKVFKNCVWLIKSFENLLRDEKNYNDVAVNPHEHTHPADAIRYFIAGQPMPNPDNEKDSIYNFDCEREQAKDFLFTDAVV